MRTTQPNRAQGHSLKLLGSMAALALARGVVPSGWLAEAMLGVAQLTAFIAVIVAARRRDDEDPTPWAAVAVGLGLLFAAELYWSWLELTDPNAFPSLADLLSAAGLTVIVVALWKTATRVSPVGDRTGFVDSAALALAAATLAWVLIIEPGASRAGLTGNEQSWIVIALALDVALLAMGARLAFALKVRPPAYLYVYLAIGASMLVDVLDSVLESGFGSEVGRAEDMIFIACSGCWTAAAMRRGPVRAAPASNLHLGARRLVLLVVCASAPLAALTLQSLRGQRLGSPTVLVVGGSGLVLAGLVAARLASLLGVVRDLTAAQGRERFAAMVENASDVILTTDAAHRISYASPSVATAWGYDPAALIGRPIAELVAAEDAALVTSQLMRAAALPARSKLTLETRVERRGGGQRICEAVAANLTDHPGVRGISISLRDITGQRSLERELRARAFNDELTGLANRALFMDRVEHALQRRADEPGAPSVLFLDLDDFKQVNDGLGHAAGDELLVAVGQRLVECVRPGDTVARLGGDEFAVLLEQRDGVSDAVRVAARLLDALALPLPAGDLYLGVRASIGIAVADEDTSANDLLRDADIAMYETKGAATDGWVVFEPEMRTAAAGRISMRSDLDKALAAGELHVVFQPIFDLAGGRMTSAEALLRWEHPTRGAVSPAEFVPVAEQSGQIVGIGTWVLEQSCLAAARWSRLGHPLGVSVNASAVQLQDATFVDRVHDALDAADLAPSLLTIEVTETAMMRDPDATAAILLRLRSLGVKVSIDDFGTGYCSLAYLRRLAVDSLKIDQAFVAEIEAESSGETTSLLVHNILRLAEALGVPAVAEGIELPAQLHDLMRHKCAYGQGFHLAMPMPSEALEQLLLETGGGLPQQAERAATLARDDPSRPAVRQELVPAE